MDIANIEAVAKLNARRVRLLELLDVAENGKPVISLELLQTSWRAGGTREVKPGPDLPAEALQNSIICLAEDELSRVNAELGRLGVQTPARKTYVEVLAPGADLSTASRAATGWRNHAIMMTRVWAREIGKVRPKAHFIDEFAGSIKDLRERADALKPLVEAIDKYRTEPVGVSDTSVALDSALAAARKVLP